MRWGGWTNKGGRQRQPQTVYLLTSLPPAVVTPAVLLPRKRADWGIEKRVHWGRAVALGEDASRLRKAALPLLWAACADLALSMLRLRGIAGLQRTMDPLHLRPDTAVALLLGRPRPAV